MSTKLTGYVWDGCAASGMKLSSVAIMARLADFSNDEGVCWPSIETIARQIGAGMSTVRTAIARLEAEGWLTRKARRQGTRLRSVHGRRLSRPVPPPGRKPRRPETPSPITSPFVTAGGSPLIMRWSAVTVCTG